MTTIGSRIGPYEVVAPLGRGGMGEVYRARDARLQRDVALKLLPASFASDPERVGRFTREAQLLAAVNHPNIGAIYGLEDSPSGAVLVLELVDGPTLAERVAQGPIAVDEAVAIGRQVADALESAHELGVVHRDLKPANIKVRPDGTVKVLDFGLAKLATAPDAATDIGASPTLTAGSTAAGVILGTAAYMAPEQARGRSVDRRADIWAFGVLLFELLTGHRPFTGETLGETLAAVIKDPPPLNRLPTAIPPELRTLIARSLEKDPKRRLRDIGEARLILEDLAAGRSSSLGANGTVGPARWRRLLPWTVAAVATVATIISLAYATRAKRPPAGEPPLLRVTLPITGDSLERTSLPAISPDGRHVVFARAAQLWVRSLDELDPRPLPGTNGAQFPFWSPDSRQVAYLTATALWKVGIDGSHPAQVATYRFSKGGRTPGGVWRTDNLIVFAPAATSTGLVAVSAEGGEFAPFYERDPKVEGDFHRPALLPDGRGILFVVDRVDRGADTIGVLVAGKRKDVLTLEGDIIDSPVYSATGHILYHRETANPGVWAVPFSLERLETTGAPFIVAPQGSHPSMSSGGTLIYADASVSGLTSLAWVDVATGAVTAAFAERFPGLGYPRLSPDARRVAAVAHLPGQGQSVIVADLERGTHIRLSDRAEAFSRPMWHDDTTVLFSRSAALVNQIYMRAADGSGSETPITRGLQPFAGSGRLLFSRMMGVTGADLFHLALPANGKPPGEAEQLQKLPEPEWEPSLSPDGTLLTYTKGDPGQSEIILRTYPDLTAQWQVSTAGGSHSVWSRAGDAIYYREISGPIYRVDVRRQPALKLSTPRLIARPSTLLARVGFDVSPDGKRLLMVEEVRTDYQRAASLALVQNWSAAFRR